MKTILKRLWIPMVLFLLLIATSGCYEVYDNTFYDNNLIGKWTLTAVNNRPVYGTEANAFQFTPNGGGTYYYYSNGIQQQMNINWYCQYGPSGNYTYVYIQYLATGNNASCIYYFRGNNLYMRFYNNYGQPTVYQYTYNGPSGPTPR